MMNRITIALAVAGGLAAAVPASAAGITVQGLPGTSCTADRRIGGPWEYRQRRLLNVGTDPLEATIAVCPISLFVPGQEPREYRIQLNDSLRRDTWCQVYGPNGTLVRMHTAPGGTWGFSGSLAYPLSWPGTGLVEATIHCLLLPGASLERIEIVWYQP
jgi:hypothetical protein